MGRGTTTHGRTRPARHRPGVVTALVCGLVAAGGLVPAVAADGAAATAAPDGAWDDSRSFDEAGAAAASAGSAGSATGADGAAGDVVVAPGRAVVGEWGDAATADQRSAGFTLDALPTATLYLAVDVASPGGTGGYRARVRVEPDGRLVVGTSTVVDGRESDYRSTTTDFVVEAGDVVNLEGDFHHAADGVVRVRAWPSDRTRPDWQHRTVDGGTAPVGPVLADRSWTYLSGSAKAPAHVAVGDVVGRGTTPVTTPAPPPPVVPTPPPPVVPTPPPPPVEPTTPTRPAGRPGADGTGVPDGTRLTRHDGDLVITTPGARYDALDIHGFVVVRAPDVTITRSLIRGGVKDGNRGLVTVDHADAKRFVIEDSTIRPDTASVWYDGIKGSNFTARRVDVWGTVDNIKVHGDDVLVEDSWLHDSRWFAWDPNQKGPSHNDGVQVLGGSRITLRGNSITGASNGAVQVTQDFREVRGLDISGNWFDGGTCSVKISHKGRDSGPQVELRDNRFGVLQSILGCSSLATHRTDLQASGNVWDLTGLPAPVRRWG